jgi:NAD(P)-dependent dehydrogenase (short-subunit alcohol dehydrogenase family)
MATRRAAHILDCLQHQRPPPCIPVATGTSASSPAATTDGGGGALRVAVSGTSVGIGLEFVRQYAAAGSRVYALCRSPAAATDLAAIAGQSRGMVTVHVFDQSSSESAAALKAELAGVPLDVVINNAAVGGSGPTRGDYAAEGQTFGDIDYAAWADTMDTNVFGVMRATEALLPSLLLSGRGPKLVQLSSAAGSISNAMRDGVASPDMVRTVSGHQQARTGSPGYFVYRSSKAAMNMVNRLLDCELSPLGVSTLVLHPGTVITRMNSSGITASESVGGMRARIAELEMGETVEFMMFDGTRIQW